MKVNLRCNLIIDDILDDETNAMIVDANGEVTYSFHKGLNKERIENKILYESMFYARSKDRILQS